MLCLLVYHRSVIHMHSSVISTIQECYYARISFGIKPNLVPNIIFNPFIVSIKRPKCFYLQPNRSRGCNITTCTIVQKKNRKLLKYCCRLAPNESMKFIGLWLDLLTYEGSCSSSAFYLLVKRLLSCINRYQCVF